MAHLLGAEGISLEYPTKVVFEKVTVGIDEGDRIGVVGRNGDGKTTLLRMLAGRLEPDSGRVTRRGGVTIGMLDQQDELATGLTVAQTVVGDRPEYEWAGDARVRDVIDGLIGGEATGNGRSGDIPWNALVDDLSGGQRRRVALAAVLTHDWDVVFLDEPTNHLDVEGVAWLAQHLKKRWPTNSGGFSTRSRPTRGRCTTPPSNHSKAATRRTSCSGWSAIGWRRRASRSARI
jgi:ATPase subunit of ABC transporter with duplicated ATPase domains